MQRMKTQHKAPFYLVGRPRTMSHRPLVTSATVVRSNGQRSRSRSHLANAVSYMLIRSGYPLDDRIVSCTGAASVDVKLPQVSRK